MKNLIPDHLKSREELLLELQSLRSGLAESGVSQKIHKSGFMPVENGMFPVIIVSLSDDKILHVNNKTSNLLGLSAEDIVGQPAANFWFDPGQREAYRERVAEKGHITEFEAEIRTTNSEKKFTQLFSSIVEFNGQAAIYTIVSDITGEKIAEKAFQESESRYHELYNMLILLSDTVPDMLWAKDLEDNYIFANKALREELLKCKEDEDPLGKSDLFFAERERFEGYRHTFGEICVNSDDVVKKNCKSGRFLEDGLVRGKYLVLDVHKAPLFGNKGELIGTVGAGRDVTSDIAIQKALAKSEAMYRLLADNVRDVIWSLDTEFMPNYVSPSVYQLLGYSPKEFLSMPVASHMTPQYKKKYRGILKLMAASSEVVTKTPPRFLEFECLHRDGSKIWVEVLTSAVWDDGGVLQGFTGVIRETTKRVQEQQELEHAKEVAIAASRTKSEFLANMSHEIRTPMNGVLGLLQLLKDSPLNETQQRYVDIALSSSNSLLNVISDILDFSKIEVGKIALVPAPLSIEKLLLSVVKSFNSIILSNKVQIYSNIDKDVPVYVLADEDRLRQILFNLIGNAVKFTKDGQISVEVRVQEVAVKQGIQLVFEISDTGIGIGADVIDHLFEPFMQEDGSFRRKYGGTGLGLSIVKSLVELMGGRIDLQSSLGVGTLVTFFIDTEKVDRPATRVAVAVDPVQNKNVSLRILVVEDEQVNAMVISAMLEKLGHHVDLAINGMQALQMVEESGYDCIFMDIQMPEMDGIETTRAIRSSTITAKRSVPIIALTAHAMKGDKERFISAGMDDYLSKPVEIKILVEVLGNVCSAGSTP